MNKIQQRKGKKIDAMRYEDDRRQQLGNIDWHDLIYTRLFHAHGVSPQANQWDGIDHRTSAMATTLIDDYIRIWITLMSYLNDELVVDRSYWCDR